MNLIKTPADYLDSYLDQVYYESPLDKMTRIEVSCAFCAGIEAVFKFVRDQIVNEQSDNVKAERIAKFRQQNMDCCIHINLSRFGEE